MWTVLLRRSEVQRHFWNAFFFFYFLLLLLILIVVLGLFGCFIFHWAGDHFFSPVMLVFHVLFIIIRFSFVWVVYNDNLNIWFWFRVRCLLCDIIANEDGLLMLRILIWFPIHWLIPPTNWTKLTFSNEKMITWDLHLVKVLFSSELLCSK